MPCAPRLATEARARGRFGLRPLRAAAALGLLGSLSMVIGGALAGAAAPGGKRTAVVGAGPSPFARPPTFLSHSSFSTVVSSCSYGAGCGSGATWRRPEPQWERCC